MHASQNLIDRPNLPCWRFRPSQATQGAQSIEASGTAADSFARQWPDLIEETET
jgi:hypothetical protein